MKVELLVNLKVKSGKIFSVGSVFSDEEGVPIPESILRRVQKRQARILPGNKMVVEKEIPPSLLPKVKTGRVGASIPVNKPVAGTKIPKTIGKKGK